MAQGGSSRTRLGGTSPHAAGSAKEIWALIDANRERFPLQLQPLPDAKTIEEAEARWPEVLENHRRVVAMLGEHLKSCRRRGEPPAT